MKKTEIAQNQNIAKGQAETDAQGSDPSQGTVQQVRMGKYEKWI